MCGIFGFIIKNSNYVNLNTITLLTNTLFKLSESRGKEAAGIAAVIDDEIKTIKMPVSASRLIRTKEYDELLRDLHHYYNYDTNNKGKNYGLIAHSRLTTNGNQEDNKNNQPVICGGLVGIHNGIIVNDEQIWNKYTMLERKSQVDTEAFLALFGHFIKKGYSLEEATGSTFNAIQGSASVAILFQDQRKMLLATNTGSLYLGEDRDRNIKVFASEQYILSKFNEKVRRKSIFNEINLLQIKPRSGCIIDMDTLECKSFKFEIIEDKELIATMETSSTQSIITRSYNTEYQDALKRCSRCLLPETFPFINFDSQGVCNYCLRHRPISVKGFEALEELAEPYRSKNGAPDCLLGFSGGRDSSYGLYFVKKVLKMNPIAFTYDWGMVTDLARRNQARICGQLGIEHILVSADIEEKRRYIGKNIEAWLRKPDLGMVPLFMAGDKQFYHFANKLKEQTGIKLFFFCAGNELEKTEFKTGFCGISAGSSKGILTNMPLAGKLKLIKYYLEQFLRNPAYINESILDTIWAYISSYAIPHDYIYLYHYIKWDEKEIMKTLAKEFNWETASDTKVTWRIGDGTASFYNYIFFTVAGFTENDTFRSNQIREGILSREEALALVREENQPRFDEIRNYCNLVGIDYQRTINIIDSIPKLKKL